MKLLILIFMLFIESNCLVAQSNDTLIIDTSIFLSIDRGNTETYLVAIQLLQKRDTIRFFVSDDSEYITYYKNLNTDDTIQYKVILLRISNYEISEMFGFHGSDFTITDESFNVMIDSRLNYYKQINVQFVGKNELPH